MKKMMLTALRNASAALDSTVHQIGQMRGMFSDSDGAIAGSVEDAETSKAEIDALIEQLEADQIPIEIGIEVEGGLVQNITTSSDMLINVYVHDHDVEGADNDQVVEITYEDGKKDEATIGSWSPDIVPFDGPLMSSLRAQAAG